MGVSFPQYVRVKDKYCCHYLGDSPEYVALLGMLKPQIEQQLPGLELYVYCNKNLHYLLKDVPEDFKESDYAYVRKIYNNHNKHSLLTLMEESGLDIKPVNTAVTKSRGLCLVCPEGIFPTKSIDPEPLVAKAKAEGYVPVVLGSDVHYSLNINVRPSGKEKLNYVSEATWVIGVENEYLVLAAEKGIRTTFVGGGVGWALYSKLFPNMEKI